MRIGELAQEAGVTVKALRYYERVGLLTPARSPNGYREYDGSHLRVVREISQLRASGITTRQARPFIECLALGHDHGDDCVTSLVVYRDSIAELDRLIADLTQRRDHLHQRLHDSAQRAGAPRPAPRPASRASSAPSPEGAEMSDYTTLPAGLPEPDDDGAAAHLPGAAVPALRLPTSDGGGVDLAELAAPGRGRVVVYLYPLTGRPGVDLPEGWDAIPGARGCSTEACDFRDHFADLRAAGVSAVFGASSQDVAYQDEVVQRLRLPFAMISDESFALAQALGLPTFSAVGHERLYARLTLVLRDGAVEHAFYPIFPPNTHAQQVLTWLRENPVS